MELFGSGVAGPPLEEANGVRAAGNMGEAVAQQLAGGLGVVDWLPVHGAGGVLHEEPGAAAGQSTGQVGAEGELGGGVAEPSVEVVVLADQVLLGGPRPVVGLGEVAADHEVRGHRHTGAQPVQKVPLGAEVVKELVGGETFVVEEVGRVRSRRGQPRRKDLVPVSVVLAPERRAPCVVESSHGPVPRTQPATERNGGVVAVAAPVVGAELVGHVPHRQGRMVPIPLRHRFNEDQSALSEHRGARAPRLPTSRPQPVTRVVHRQDLRVGPRQPRGRRCRGGGQVHRDPAGVEQAEHLVEPAEVEGPLARLQEGPGEDCDRGERDAGLTHEPYVLRPDLSRPLFGVVVTAREPDPRGATAQESWCSLLWPAVKSADVPDQKSV